MDYRYLGKSGVKVSPITLGTMMFGGATDETVSRRIIDKARERDINFIDTADVYNKGKSEEVVGRAIADRRDWWFIATKLANPMGDGINERGLSRKWICQAVDASLKRLGTDYIDLIYLHRAVFDSPLEETTRAVADLIRQGKLRYFGVSNFRGWRIAEISRIADLVGIDRPIASRSTTSSTGPPKLSSCRRQPITVSAWYPIALWRAASSPPSMHPMRPLPPTPAPDGQTSASWKQNGGQSQSASRVNWRRMPKCRAQRPPTSHWPGCSTTSLSPPRLPVHGPRSSAAVLNQTDTESRQSLWIALV